MQANVVVWKGSPRLYGLVLLALTLVLAAAIAAAMLVASGAVPFIGPSPEPALLRMSDPATTLCDVSGNCVTR